MRTLLFLIPALVLAADPAATTKAPAKPAAKNFKESGSATATVTIEAFTDYECPHCALFFKSFMPQFSADYIQTGKVKFIHRDFPLSQHPHAQLAARYANAAGQVGLYEVVVNQIFATQDTWSVNGKNTGDLDGEVAKVVPPGAMQKIREIVKTDTHLDDSVKADMNFALNIDHIPSTPSIVVVSKGKRDVLSTVMEMPYPIFKKWLDEKIAGK